MPIINQKVTINGKHIIIEGDWDGFAKPTKKDGLLSLGGINVSNTVILGKDGKKLYTRVSTPVTVMNKPFKGKDDTSDEAFEI